MTTKQMYRIDGYTGYANPYLMDCFGSQEFETLTEAQSAAKKVAARKKEDVKIWKIDSVIKFPEPVFEIETVV